MKIGVFDGLDIRFPYCWALSSRFLALVPPPVDNQSTPLRFEIHDEDCPHSRSSSIPDPIAIESASPHPKTSSGCFSGRVDRHGSEPLRSVDRDRHTRRALGNPELSGVVFHERNRRTHHPIAKWPAVTTQRRPVFFAGSCRRAVGHSRPPSDEPSGVAPSTGRNVGAQRCSPNFSIASRAIIGRERPPRGVGREGRVASRSDLNLPRPKYEGQPLWVPQVPGDRSRDDRLLSPDFVNVDAHRELLGPLLPPRHPNSAW
jgi:hypothetical protein